MFIDVRIFSDTMRDAMLLVCHDITSVSTTGSTFFIGSVANLRNLDRLVLNEKSFVRNISIYQYPCAASSEPQFRFQSAVTMIRGALIFPHSFHTILI